MKKNRLLACAAPSTQFTERFLHIGGHRVFVVEMGHGPPLVLLPSMLTYAWSYRETIRRLAECFRVIAVEAPGSGRSSHLPTYWSFRDFGRWVGDFLDTLDLNGVTLIGHSNSGAVAIAAAALAPRRIARLVLADATGADAGRAYGKMLLGRAIDGLLEPLLTLSGWHHVALNAAMHPRSALHQIRLAREESLMDLARSIETPTLIAWGGRDHTMRPRGADRLHEAIRRSTVVWRLDASHDWIVTHPSAFARHVIQFGG